MDIQYYHSLFICSHNTPKILKRDTYEYER
nr:MAG TPA: Protein of unknown function (DUF1033) [Caudoviricetes sp.]